MNKKQWVLERVLAVEQLSQNNLDLSYQGLTYSNG